MFEEFRKHLRSGLKYFSQSNYIDYNKTVTKHLDRTRFISTRTLTLQSPHYKPNSNKSNHQMCLPDLTLCSKCDSQSPHYKSSSNKSNHQMCSTDLTLCSKCDSRRTVNQGFSSKSNERVRESTNLGSSLSSDSMASSSSFSSSSRRLTDSVCRSSISQWLWSMFICLMLMAVRCEGDVDVGDSLKDVKMADEYLSTFGYYGSHHKQQLTDINSDITLKNNIPAQSDSHTDSERHHAVERLQTFFHLPVTGQLDTKTKEVLTAPRCGREDMDVEEEEDEQRRNKRSRRKKRYSISKYADGSYQRWSQSKLTWRITQPTRQIAESQQREAIRKALAMWATVVPIQFVEDRGSDTPDINIRFVRREHGPATDPVFDGSPSETKNVLAHAWGPSGDSKGLAGDVHIDDDDDWRDFNNLLGVAVHELGHSMGLGHSKNEKAIMYPLYRDVVDLHSDDIEGIKLLYGPSSGNRGRPVTLNPKIWTHKPYPRYTPRPDSRYRTDHPDFRIRTRRPDTRYQTRRPEGRYRTQRPESRFTTARPDTRYRTSGPRYRTNRPDPRYRTERPDSRYRTIRPDSRYRTNKPDSRYRTNRPDSRYRTNRPDSRYRTNRPDPGYRTNRPDSRYRTERPDSRYRTNKPDNGLYTEKPPTEDICKSLDVKAVFEDPATVLGRHYLAISGDHVHRLTSRGTLLRSSPLASVYPDAPKNIDVAFSLREKESVYFIKDNKMWAYKRNKLQEGYPRSLHNLQFPERPRFSVTLKERNGNSRLLLFGQSYWWTFDVDYDRARAIHYESISDFNRKIPRDVLFAARWTDNYLYAVTADSYVVMDVERREIIQEEPIAGKPQWLHALCGDGSRISSSALVTTLVSLISMLAIVNKVFS